MSLPRARDRRQGLLESFSAFDTPYEIVDAVDGLELSDVQLHQYSRERALFQSGRELTRGELGCALSHLKLYERLVAGDVPAAVVMEDDVVPTKELFAVLAEIDAFPADWDVVTLHSLFESSAPRPIDDRVIAGKYRICTYRRTPFGTQCYVIRLAAAKQILSVAYPVGMPLDALLFRRRPARLRVYGIEPRVAIEGSFPSELVARSGGIGDHADLTLTMRDQAIVLAGKVRRRLPRLR